MADELDPLRRVKAFAGAGTLISGAPEIPCRTKPRSVHLDVMLEPEQLIAHARREAQKAAKDGGASRSPTE
jgi:hypothetical protein